MFRAGPLNADRFLLANTRLAVGEDMSGGGADSLKELCSPLLGPAIGAPRTSRMPLGKWDDALGVVGRTLTDVCGDRLTIFADAVGVSRPFEDTEDALECECAWWIVRMDETDDEVDLRPRRPADDRR